MDAMKLLYINNIPAHYQHAFASALHGLLGDDFRMAYIQSAPADRLAMGWQDLGIKEAWVLRVWENEAARREYLEWMRQADVVCCGTFEMLPEALPEYRERIQAGGLCLSFSERIHKIARHPLRLVLSNIRRRWRMRAVVRPNHHLLTLGAYVAGDYVRAGFPLSRCWQFGYIAPVPDRVRRREGHRAVPEILWAGRMLGWKKVDTLLRAGALLRDGNMPFRLSIIGDGDCRCVWQNLARELKLDEHVTWYSAATPGDVAEAMEQADIYVMPSNREEGWGVALAEAMAAGCACGAAVEAGATRVLIRDGENGFHFQAGDAEGLARQLAMLLTDATRRSQMGAQARKTMLEQWHPDVVAAQLIGFAQALLNGRQPVGPPSGLFSPAQCLSLDEEYDGIGACALRWQERSG
jgi:glycosyltransferase involved in cell wall biosynthesis